MKTTMNNLRTEIAAKTKLLEKLQRTITSNALIHKIEEASGLTKQMNEVVEIEPLIEQYKMESKNLASLKAKVSSLNNTLTISDGKTIQEALATLESMRKVRYLMELLSGMNKSTRRMTDGGMAGVAYYEIREQNFNLENIVEELEHFDKEIDRLELEISNANSKEIDV